MAEIASRQKAKVDAGDLVTGAEGLGKVRSITITTPATHALGTNDTIASGIKLPVNTRILRTMHYSCVAMTGVSVDVGLRNFHTKAVIDADGIINGQSLAAVGSRPVGTNEAGALFDEGAEYFTTEEAELYVTIAAGSPAANAQFALDFLLVTDD